MTTMKTLTLDQTLGIVRHTLTILGTLLIASGNVLEGSWEVITGSTIALASVVWSVFSKDTHK
jgi:hypothetical protein